MDLYTPSALSPCPLTYANAWRHQSVLTPLACWLTSVQQALVSSGSGLDFTGNAAGGADPSGPVGMTGDSGNGQIFQPPGFFINPGTSVWTAAASTNICPCIYVFWNIFILLPYLYTHTYIYIHTLEYNLFSYSFPVTLCFVCKVFKFTLVYLKKKSFYFFTATVVLRKT